MLDILPVNPLRSNTRFQNQDKWPQQIQSNGCHYFCFLAIIEDYFDCIFHPGWVINTFSILKEENILSKESFVVYPDKFLELLAPGVFDFLGIQKPEFITLEGDYILAMYEYPTENLKHFVIVDRAFNILYDPWEGGCRTTNLGKLKNIRVLRPIGIK